MPTKQQLEGALKNADAAGDTAAARQIASAIKYGQYDEPTMGVGEAFVGAGETLATLATGAIAEPIAGIAGAAQSINPFAEEGAGARTVGAVQEALTYQPRTEAGQAIGAGIAGSAPVQALARAGEAVGEGSGDVVASAYEAVGLDPAVGYAIGKSIPVAAMEALGLKAPKQLAGQASKQAEILEGAAAAERAEIEALTSGRPTRGGVEQVAEQVSEAPESIAEIAQFDPAIVKAANDLGFDEIPASVAAGNAQFRDIAQGMASVSGSQAKAQYGQFLEQLANKADDLIVEGGGDIDKAALSARYFDETERVINEIGQSESALYRDIEAAVTPSAKVPVSQLRSYIGDKVSEFGGVENLPKPLKDIHSLVYKPNGAPRTPTYAAFNQKRREIGQSIGGFSGPYSDAETGALKDLYGAIKGQQRAIVDGAGVGDIQDAADALTIKRNAIQDTKTEILGKNLSKDLMPQVAAKITGLPKGNVTKFNQLIKGVPENMRKEVVVSALNDIMRGTGADQKGLGAARFVGFMNDLNRSPKAKSALYKHLPPKTRTALDNLNKVASGVYKANKENITTGKISQFFPENDTFIGRLMGAGKGAAIGTAGAVGGRVAAEAAEAAAENVSEFLSGTSNRAQAANEFMASPKLQELMKRAVRDGVVDGGLITDKTKRLESIMKRSKAYQKWADTLSGSDAAKLASVGLASYLLSPEVSEGDDNPEGG